MLVDLYWKNEMVVPWGVPTVTGPVNEELGVG